MKAMHHHLRINRGQACFYTLCIRAFFMPEKVKEGHVRMLDARNTITSPRKAAVAHGVFQ